MNFAVEPTIILMPKTWLLCISAKLNLRHKIWGEVEKSFIALPGKGGHRWLMPWETVCPNLGKFGEKFYSSGSRAGLLIRLRVCKGALRSREQQKLRWLDGITDGQEFEQALGVGDGQGGLACCSPWGCKELDTTELNWTGDLLMSFEVIKLCPSL